MTSEQIERLRKGLGSTATSTTQEDVTKLLDEREALLKALREVTVKLGDARSVLSHCWAAERPPTNQDWLDAEAAEDAAEKAIAKAESP